MMEIVLAVLGLMMIAAAVMVIYSRDIVGAIIASGVVSLLASIVYLVAGAPDVAMTEAAIGSGLTTVVFLFAWSRIRHLHGEDAIPETDADTAGGTSDDPDKNRTRRLVENRSDITETEGGENA